MILTLRPGNVMSTRVGHDGLDEPEFREGMDRAAQAYAEVRAERPGFLDLPARLDVARAVKRFAAKARRFRNFVQIGIGGSALGAIAVQTALRHRFHNEVATPRMYFLDNVDPEETRALFDHLDPKKTFFHVVTKSGETTETLAGFLIALQKLSPKKWKDHLVVTTDPQKGFLRSWTETEKITRFEIPPKVGGRFSVLTPVGLLPAAVSGVDPVALLKGAAMADTKVACTLAAIAHGLDTKRGKRIHVMMPYARALKDLADWHRQLWAESLGKNPSTGPTPVVSLGATDQHSQIQLYAAGPNDKFILLVGAAKFRADIRIPRLLNHPSVDFLHGKRIGEVLHAEQQGTETALTAANRPNATLTFPEISPKSVGAFFQTFEVATAVAAKLYEVNAYDQPGVEAGKKAAFALLGKRS